MTILFDYSAIVKPTMFAEGIIAEPPPVGTWDSPFAVEPFEPSEQDRQDAAEAFGSMEAQAHLDHSGFLTLAELADRQCDFYRGWGNETGEMFARAMEALALKIRLTESETPAEFAARSDALDESARECWESIGYDSARRDCRCEG